MKKSFVWQDSVVDAVNRYWGRIDVKCRKSPTASYHEFHRGTNCRWTTGEHHPLAQGLCTAASEETWHSCSPSMVRLDLRYLWWIFQHPRGSKMLVETVFRILSQKPPRFSTSKVLWKQRTRQLKFCCDLRSQISQHISNTLISAKIFALAFALSALRSKSRNTNGENLGAYIEEAPTCGDFGDVKRPKTWNLIAVLPEGTTESQNVETAWVSYIFSQVWRRQRCPKSLQYEPPKRTTPFVRIYFEPLIYAALAAVTLEQNPQHHGTVSEPSRAKWEMETLPAVLIVLAYRVLAKILLDRWVHTTPAPPSIQVFWIKSTM